MHPIHFHNIFAIMSTICDSLCHRCIAVTRRDRCARGNHMAGQCVQSLSQLSRMFAHQFAVICGVRDNNESGGEGVVALQARRHYRDVSSEHERQWRPYRWCKWCGAPGPTTLGAHQPGPDSNFKKN